MDLPLPPLAPVELQLTDPDKQGRTFGGIIEGTDPPLRGAIVSHLYKGG
jgi:hypothetical protein